MTVPWYSKKKFKEIPKKCRLLRWKYLNDHVEIILEDEEHFSYGWSNGNQNMGFYTDNSNKSPGNI